MTQLKPLVVMLVACGILALPLSVLAGEEKTQETEKPSFDSVDANLDGVITPAEAEDTWLAVWFSEVDINQDGLVNRSEYESALS